MKWSQGTHTCNAYWGGGVIWKRCFAIKITNPVWSRCIWATKIDFLLDCWLIESNLSRVSPNWFGIDWLWRGNFPFYGVDAGSFQRLEQLNRTFSLRLRLIGQREGKRWRANVCTFVITWHPHLRDFSVPLFFTRDFVCVLQSLEATRRMQALCEEVSLALNLDVVVLDVIIAIIDCFVRHCFVQNEAK